MWSPERVKALRLSRKQNQTDFAASAGVDRVTVSRWETGASPVSDLSAIRLDTMAAAPRDPTHDYQRGVLYACEAMSETIARLLREQREAEDIIRQTALARLAELPPADAPPPTETSQGQARTGALPRTGRTR